MPFDDPQVFDARRTELAPLSKTQVVHHDRRFRLRERIEVLVKFRDGLWVHEFEPLGIIAWGPTRSASLAAFGMDFASCWDTIAQADDDDLTRGAQELKGKLRALVAEVDELA